MLKEKNLRKQSNNAPPFAHNNIVKTLNKRAVDDHTTIMRSD